MKRKARITFMVEYDLAEVPGLTPEQVLDLDCKAFEDTVSKGEPVVTYASKAFVVRKEVM